jgi:putative oxidoreductase
MIKMNSGFLSRPTILLLSRIILGVIFIYASIDKILNPLAFAQIIHHYRLTPPGLINTLAIVMPWIEFSAGLLLIVGFKVRSSALIVSLLLIFFAVVLAVTAFRGINVACGCFTTSASVKSNLVIRIIEDIAILILGLHVLFFYRRRKPAGAVAK